jgi:predicted ATP-dependent protease
MRFPTPSASEPMTTNSPPPDSVANSCSRTLPAEALRWHCDPAVFGFETTDEIEPIAGVIGQDVALEALRFGLECGARGQNIYVRGLSGTGRMTLVRRLLGEINPACALAPDHVYVHNFEDPRRPRLITLPRGRGTAFGQAIDRLIEFINDELARALSSETVSTRVKALQRTTQEKIKTLTAPLEQSLQSNGLALVTITGGQVARPAIFPVVNGEPVPPEVFEMERAKGNVSDEDYERVQAGIEANRDEVDGLASRINEVMEEHIEATRKVLEGEVRSFLAPARARLEAQFDQADAREFIGALFDDLLENLRVPEIDLSFTELYRVNVVQGHGPRDECPKIVENAPSLANLVGGIEHHFPGADELPGHLSIRGGSILRADGGYLILEARDVLAEPGAWKALVRTLRTGRLEVTPVDQPWLPVVQLKPEPIEVNVKVILIGDPDLFYLLDQLDPDFPQLFKVLAEFDTLIPRVLESLRHYAGVIRRVADEEGLPAFHRDAIAAIAEHGARVASARERLTTRFSRLADIAREAGFLASKAGRLLVTGEDVRETVRRTKRRASLPSRKFRELLADGTIRVQTSGRAIGQVNGLAVISAGPLTYGFPARITATIGPGSSGVINIERESALSGAIHTKGFFILGGLLRHLLRTPHPLVFDASIAFEQSYGGIDGDSASGAEICCLLSALTQIPVRQDLAMTGAIDQMGNILAIGGVNEKVEGFFDTCRDVGLTGTQGVVIPESNTGELMLRHELVDACRAGQFHVHAVSTIHEALGLLLDTPSGFSPDAEAAPETIIGQARHRAHEYWKMAVATGRGGAKDGPPAGA